MLGSNNLTSYYLIVFSREKIIFSLEKKLGIPIFFSEKKNKCTYFFSGEKIFSGKKNRYTCFFSGKKISLEKKFHVFFIFSVYEWKQRSCRLEKNIPTIHVYFTFHCMQRKPNFSLAEMYFSKKLNFFLRKKNRYTYFFSRKKNRYTYFFFRRRIFLQKKKYICLFFFSEKKIGIPIFFSGKNFFSGKKTRYS